jgi:anaerobic magnesium-protoporphyrin IX monomethyl ester cyclase
MPPQTQARVVLVGFEDQDNLGLRYLSSRLREAGHLAQIVTVSQGIGPILATIEELNPHVVGFSLIFQYLAPQFAGILRDLRSRGVPGHFTMGGHYASFRPSPLFEAMPELDSVVRFEGEDTLVELAAHIANGRSWHNTLGIAYRGELGVVLNAQRAGRKDLDELPWPDRDDVPYHLQRLPTASVLGGRGCPWKCSFCSIITFYEANGTKGRRRRDPVKIVDELEHLHKERGVQVILWQDDDFLAGGRLAVSWAHAIAAESVRRSLHHGLRWKISCRSDEVSEQALIPLKEAGLTHVYMGIESADKDNLIHLNKRLQPEVHVRAGELLRKLELSFDFGFMLLEPWSTPDTVLNNLRFLREFTGDGASSAGFCRTLPYAGTPIEELLIAEGRLTEHDFNADYRFLDPCLDRFYDWTLQTFAERNFSAQGTANLLRLLLFEAHLNLPQVPSDRFFRERVRALTAVSNKLLVDTTEAALHHIRRTPGDPEDDAFLSELAGFYRHQDEQLRRDIGLLTADLQGLPHRLHLELGSDLH